MANLLGPALVDSLRRIVEDAARATEADERALESERPLFGALLDASIPQFGSHWRVTKKQLAANVQRTRKAS